MFKKLIRKAARKIGIKGVAAEVIADKADDVVFGVLDKATGGIAGDVERVAKKVKSRKGR